MLKVAFLSRVSWPLFYIFKYLFPCSYSALTSDETSSPALASFSWTHLFLPRLWKPAPAWVRSALDKPPPSSMTLMRNKKMNGWMDFSFSASITPSANLLYRHICARRAAVCWKLSGLEISLTKIKPVGQGERPLWRVPSCLSSYSDTCSLYPSAKPFTFINVLNEIKKNPSRVKYYTCARKLTVHINWP